MKKVYRVEKNGFGPYRSIWSCTYDGVVYTNYDLSNSHFGSKIHPTPWSDRIGGRYEFFCGFLSIYRLRNWFNNNWCKILHEAGFVVSVYDVDERDILIGKSKRQIVFRKESAKFIKEFSLLNV